MRNALSAQQLSAGQRVKMFIQKSPARMAFIIAGLLYLATIIKTPSSFNASAIGSIIMLTLLLSIASAGQTIVLIGGGMDFGVGAVMSSAAILTTTIMNGEDGHFLQLLVTALAMGALVGLLNGVCSVKIGLPPMIVTLAISNVVTRMQYVLTQGSPMGYASPTFIKTVTARLFGLQFLPSIVLYAVVLLSAQPLPLRQAGLSGGQQPHGGAAQRCERGPGADFDLCVLRPVRRLCRHAGCGVYERRPLPDLR